MENLCVTCKNNMCVSRVPMFSLLNYEDMVEITKMIAHRDFSRGEFLCKEGDKSSALFIVNQGKVKLCKHNRDGKEQILSILSDGSMFGEYYLFSDYEPYNFSAVALDEVKICMLSKKDMDYLFSKHPDIIRKVIAELANKLVKTEKLAQNLSTLNTDSKVAYILIELAEEYGKEVRGHIEMNIPITREEMASYAGVTRETMSRKLNAFEKSGWIETRGNKVLIIKNAQAIKDMI